MISFWLALARRGYLLAAFLVLAVFSAFAFGPEGPWMRARSAAGGLLPETQPGFPPIEPQRSLDALAGAGAIPAYLQGQALDIPFAVLNFAFMSLALAMGLKAARAAAGGLRFLLLAPLVYLVCEFIEDALLSAFASGAFAPAENLVLIQQLMTTLKLSSMGVALISILLFAAGALLKRHRGGRLG